MRAAHTYAVTGFRTSAGGAYSPRSLCGARLPRRQLFLEPVEEGIDLPHVVAGPHPHRGEPDGAHVFGPHRRPGGSQRLHRLVDECIHLSRGVSLT